MTAVASSDLSRFRIAKAMFEPTGAVACDALFAIATSSALRRDASASASDGSVASSTMTTIRVRNASVRTPDGGAEIAAAVVAAMLS